MLLTHESQALIASLAEVCIETIMLACSMGTVIIITNSVPGWVDQSSQLFMPQMTEFMKKFNIIARPMRAPLTFKTSAFQREFRTFKNLISICDGNAERTASLRLQSAPDLVMCSLGGMDAKESSVRHVKSVKLMEMPTCQQLHMQQEMLQQRLADIVGFRGHLDLKSRFSGTSLGAMQMTAKAGSCNLVHFSKPCGGSSGMGMAWPSDEKSAGSRAKTAGLTSPVGSIADRGLHSSPSSPGLSRPSGRQLPLLGGLGGMTSGKTSGESSEVPGSAAILDRFRAEERSERSSSEPDGGTAAADTLMQAIGGNSADKVDASESDMKRSSSVADARTDADGNDKDGRRRSSTPLLAGGGLWKVQSMERGSRSHSGAGKKTRPVLPTNLGARSSGAAWRENSAPVSLRPF